MLDRLFPIEFILHENAADIHVFVLKKPTDNFVLK